MRKKKKRSVPHIPAKVVFQPKRGTLTRGRKKKEKPRGIVLAFEGGGKEGGGFPVCRADKAEGVIEGGRGKREKEKRGRRLPVSAYIVGHATSRVKREREKTGHCRILAASREW